MCCSGLVARPGGRHARPGCQKGISRRVWSGRPARGGGLPRPGAPGPSPGGNRSGFPLAGSARLNAIVRPAAWRPGAGEAGFAPAREPADRAAQTGAGAGGPRTGEGRKIFRPPRRAAGWPCDVERVTGIEPAWPAWKIDRALRRRLGGPTVLALSGPGRARVAPASGPGMARPTANLRVRTGRL